MKQHYRDKLSALKRNNLSDPNKKKPDLKRGDREFL